MLAAHAARDRVNAHVLNVGSETLSVAEIASIVASVVPAEIEHAPDAPDARSYRVSFDKIKGARSFAPRFTVIDGVHGARLRRPSQNSAHTRPGPVQGRGAGVLAGDILAPALRELAESVQWSHERATLSTTVPKRWVRDDPTAMG